MKSYVSQFLNGFSVWNLIKLEIDIKFKNAVLNNIYDNFNYHMISYDNWNLAGQVDFNMLETW